MPFHHPITGFIGLAWAAFLLYWFVMAFRVKRTVRRQSVASRLGETLGVMAAFILIWSDNPVWGPLESRFVPRGLAWVVVGAIITWIGVAIAIWARTILGGNWSSAVTVKQGHTLVRTGPYTVVRHPIYSGLILALLGTALAIGEWRALLAVLVFFLTFWVKSRTEERFMTEEFGREYEDYRRGTSAIIPFIF